jgi:hypothetical protein
VRVLMFGIDALFLCENASYSVYLLWRLYIPATALCVYLCVYLQAKS